MVVSVSCPVAVVPSCAAEGVLGMTGFAPAEHVSFQSPAVDDDSEVDEDRYDGDEDDEDDEEEEDDYRSSQSSSPRAVQTSPLLRLDTEAFALVLGYLSPSEALHVASAPVCKDWHEGYAFQPELWRTLCYQEPFGARTKPHKVPAASDHKDDSSSVDSEDSEDDSDSDLDDDESLDMEHEIKRTFGRHRLLFSRFVRCQRYLARIQDDAKMGRAAPSIVEYAATTSKSDAPPHKKKTPADLHRFLSRARHTHHTHHHANAAARAPPPPPSSSSTATAPSSSLSTSTEPIALADDGKARHTSKREASFTDHHHQPTTKKARFGASALTQRLMLGASGPTIASAPPVSATPPAASTAALPWSCAIYSIANWMVAYPRAVGIQSLCLDALPCLMEDERHRLVAQRAGLADLVLMAMTRFPTVSKLQTSALHAIVLLARPIGGREGQLFSLSMAAQHHHHPNASSPPWNTTTTTSNSSTTTASNSSNTGQGHGIQVVLDSMRRFPNDENLQAMGCWSLVNLALPPDQKDLLLRNGGIDVILNSMTHHPFSVEVQFRALFSLINLVIPAAPVASVVGPYRGGGLAPPIPSTMSTMPLPPAAVEQTVGQVAAAMKHFCSNATILNRACLVLHNLSLTPDHHASLLLDADCFHLLEWCVASYPTDAVLQQSASAALQRLQATLSTHESLRRRFQAQHIQRKTALEAELLLPEDELWISDSDSASGTDDSDEDAP